MKVFEKKLTALDGEDQELLELRKILDVIKNLGIISGRDLVSR